MAAVVGCTNLGSRDSCCCSTGFIVPSVVFLLLDAVFDCLGGLSLADEEDFARGFVGEQICCGCC